MVVSRTSFIQIVGQDLISETTIVYFIVPMILTAASLFALFISEQITNKQGIGNGTSLIIFAGIAARLPFQFQSAFIYYIGDLKGSNLTASVLSFITYIFSYLAILLVIAIVYVAERHFLFNKLEQEDQKPKKKLVNYLLN
ncbi:hypothetical protein NW062_05850 [Mycoplasmopsis cynos]|nr:hypothetical protein NW062_05850 [Mycoplasmopsis cynos]